MESVLEVTVVTEGTPLVAVGLVAPPIAYCSCKAGVRLSPPLQLVKVSPEAVTVPLAALPGSPTLTVSIVISGWAWRLVMRVSAANNTATR